MIPFFSRVRVQWGGARSIAFQGTTGLSRLDRLIAALSPAAGIRRATARAALARLAQPQPAPLTQEQQDRIEATAAPGRTPRRWFARPEP